MSMAMSRKHYRRAAEIIQDELFDLGELQREGVYVRPAYDSLKAVAVGLASMFKADNPAFDREKFMDACGL